jgi:hypothetical protein
MISPNGVSAKVDNLFPLFTFISAPCDGNILSFLYKPAETISCSSFVKLVLKWHYMMVVIQVQSKQSVVLFGCFPNLQMGRVCRGYITSFRF